MKSLVFVLAGLTCLFGQSMGLSEKGWILDDSCKTSKDPRKENLIAQMADSAFEMANLAHDELEKQLSGKQKDVDIQNALKWMFLPDNKGPKDIVLPEFDKLRSTLQNVTELSKRLPDTTSRWKNPNVVIIYCTLDRFKKRKNGDWSDKAAKLVIPDADYQACFPQTPNAKKGVAWTNVQYNHPEHASHLQLCPWWVDLIMEAKYVTFKDLPKKALLGPAEWERKMKQAGWNGVPIDTVGLFDRTFLHELTHTRYAGETFDNAYKWKPCRDLAKKDIPGIDEKSAQRNADSIAFAGLAIRLNKYRQRPLRVLEDGMFEIK
ncbi:hypothetical protein AJ79_08512 [Helicocarpus griseus UAMH5409]|uniref:Lysine-specific metallo-endopeptidase domain-containing protein n=1 Tax=Helicocarpus griseus UAMH5409 TaxID=1447875 RepID=A0A2B7WSS0_9EURO|nr:hypothetical protein AJ79_08512 [Helicocarpus griseus UAMH5409]